MEKIYSRVQPETLLHIVVRQSDFKSGRQDIIEPDQFIQCSILQLNQGHTFRPHKHNWRTRTWDIIAQESWHIVRGRVKCLFYDLDDKLLSEPILNEGDSSFTLEGGHTYLILEDSEILEYKTGKYEGQKIDKTFIE